MSERATERDEWTDEELAEHAGRVANVRCDPKLDQAARRLRSPGDRRCDKHHASHAVWKKGNSFMVCHGIDGDGCRFKGTQAECRVVAETLNRLYGASTDAPEEPSNVELLLIGWENAYPESIFPPPPIRPEKGARLIWVDEVGERLSDTFTIDSVSAAMGRSMAKALRRAFDEDADAAPDRGGERTWAWYDDLPWLAEELTAEQLAEAMSVLGNELACRAEPTHEGKGERAAHEIAQGHRPARGWVDDAPSEEREPEE